MELPPRAFARLIPYSVQESPKFPGAGRVTQLAKCLGLDLPNTLPGYGEGLPDLFESMFAAVFQAKAHLDDLFLAWRERTQYVRGLVFQVDVDHRLCRRDDGAIFDEVAEMRIFLFADRG